MNNPAPDFSSAKYTGLTNFRRWIRSIRFVYRNVGVLQPTATQWITGIYLSLDSLYFDATILHLEGVFDTNRVTENTKTELEAVLKVVAFSLSPDKGDAQGGRDFEWAKTTVLNMIPDL